MREISGMFTQGDVLLIGRDITIAPQIGKLPIQGEGEGAVFVRDEIIE